MRGYAPGANKTAGGVFNVDMSDVVDLARELKGPQVRGIIGKAMTNAGQRSGRIVRDASNKHIGNKSGASTGRLAKSGTVKGTVKTAGLVFETDVIWNAKSDTGFPYAKVHHDGRGPVFPVVAKCLSWVSGGSRIFAMSAGPAAGTKFAEKGLAESEQRITAEHDRAARTIGQQVEALI